MSRLFLPVLDALNIEEAKENYLANLCLNISDIGLRKQERDLKDRVSPTTGFVVTAAHKYYDSEKNPTTKDVFTTHDTNLLSSAKLRRDQIYFAEKNDWESTEFYYLSDFKYITKKDRAELSERERPDADKEGR